MVQPCLFGVLLCVGRQRRAQRNAQFRCLRNSRLFPGKNDDGVRNLFIKAAPGFEGVGGFFADAAGHQRVNRRHVRRDRVQEVADHLPGAGRREGQLGARGVKAHEGGRVVLQIARHKGVHPGPKRPAVPGRRVHRHLKVAQPVGQRLGHIVRHRLIRHPVSRCDHNAVFRQTMLPYHPVQRDLVRRGLNRGRRGGNLIQKQKIQDIFALIHLEDFRLEPDSQRPVGIGRGNAPQVHRVEQKQAHVRHRYTAAGALFQGGGDLPHRLGFAHARRPPQHHRGKFSKRRTRPNHGKVGPRKKVYQLCHVQRRQVFRRFHCSLLFPALRFCCSQV